MSQSLSPQGYNYGMSPKNINPFWNNEGGDAGIWLPRQTEVEDGVQISWVKSESETPPTPVVLTNGHDGQNGENGANGQDGVTPDITVEATVDNNTGTPSVTVTKSGTTEDPVFTFEFSNIKGAQGERGLQGETGATGATGAQGPQGLQGEQGIQGIQGPQGTPGVTPAITAAATVDNNTGTPGVQVTQTGTPDSPVLTFNFTNLKGAQGATGPQGPQGTQGQQGATGPAGSDGVSPVVSASASVDSNIGTPGVTVTKTGTDAAPNFAFNFTNLKGATGQQGATGATGPQGPGVQILDTTITTLSDLDAYIKRVAEDGDIIIVALRNIYTSRDTVDSELQQYPFIVNDKIFPDCFFNEGYGQFSPSTTILMALYIENHIIKYASLPSAVKSVSDISGVSGVRTLIEQNYGYAHYYYTNGNLTSLNVYWYPPLYYIDSSGIHSTGIGQTEFNKPIANSNIRGVKVIRKVS